MENKIFGSICLVLGIIIIVSTGTTFAYFTATTSSNGDAISGETMNFDVKLSATPIYKATHIVPLEDDLIDDAITKNTNKCIDNSKGYEVCSLYTLTLTNDGVPQILNGYISTSTSDKPYTTDNLKFQLFDSDYNPVSDVSTVSRTVGGKVYFQNTENNIAIEVNNTTRKEVTYYLAIWLHETGAPQDEDYSKTFSGKVVFESLYGNQISADFSA